MRRLPQVGGAKARTSDAALRFEQGWRHTRHAGFIHAQVQAHTGASLAALVEGQEQGIGHVQAAGVVHIVAASPQGRAAFIARERR